MNKIPILWTICPFLSGNFKTRTLDLPVLFGFTKSLSADQNDAQFPSQVWKYCFKGRASVVQWTLWMTGMSCSKSKVRSAPKLEISKEAPYNGEMDSHPLGLGDAQSLGTLNLKMQRKVEPVGQTSIYLSCLFHHRLFPWIEIINFQCLYHIAPCYSYVSLDTNRFTH